MTGADGPKVAALLDAVDDARVVELTRTLVQIPTENPPGDELAAADTVREAMTAAGLTVEVDEFAERRVNVVGRYDAPQPGPTLVCNAHVDVIPAGDGWDVDPYAAEIHDGRLVGRGSADTKSGLAAMIEAAGALIATGGLTAGSLVVAAVADEEATQAGTRRLRERTKAPDWVLVAEPSQLRPVIAHKGGALLRVTVTGDSAHGSRPWLGVSAVEHAARAVAALAEHRDDVLGEIDHPLLGSPSLNVSRIEGGWSDFAVADECTFTVDRRSLPDEDPARLGAELDDLLAGPLGGVEGLTWSVETLFDAPAMETPADHPLVTTVADAIRQVTGRDAVPEATMGGTDGGLYSEDGVPVVVIGPGAIETAHRPGEYVPIDDIPAAARVYALTAARLLTDLPGDPGNDANHTRGTR